MLKDGAPPRSRAEAATDDDGLGWGSSGTATRVAWDPDIEPLAAFVADRRPVNGWDGELDGFYWLAGQGGFGIKTAPAMARYVAAMILDGGVGYVGLNPVSSSSAREVATAIEQLQAQGMKALIFDLRSNPGGLLDQGVAVTELFLDRDDAIVSTRGRAPRSTETYRDEQPERWPELPIVVLVNGFSASAAEIIAGVLQDHDRALVVGTPTFGKGLVQSFWRLTPETGLKLTTARWYTPSGRTIQRRFASEEEQEAQVLSAARGQDSAAVDSTEVFRTEGGRTVHGGGGIRPDLLVVGDTFTTAERAFRSALGAKIPVYRDVIASYALEIKAQNVVRDRSFRVPDTMVDEVLRRLVARGAAVDAATAAGARALIARDLGYEVARYVFGREAEYRRRMADDRQIEEALRLARRARTPQELFTFARPAPAPSRN